MTAETTPEQRQAAALAQARSIVADLTEHEVREAYARLQVEWSRLNDRHMAILVDRRVWSDRVRAAATWQARFHARSTLQHASRDLPDPFALLQVIRDLPDRPTTEQIHGMRLAAASYGLQHAAWQGQRTPDEELVDVLRATLRAENHDSVLRWQAVGGVDDDGHATVGPAGDGVTRAGNISPGSSHPADEAGGAR